ncbi:hypothetical protein BDQ17DRAFT_1434054 [Cyathus striatus]|nr:hypothetical protein BDQ17DRAFT_1434054 [Cyathus striatus]
MSSIAIITLSLEDTDTNKLILSESQKAHACTSDRLINQSCISLVTNLYLSAYERRQISSLSQASTSTVQESCAMYMLLLSTDGYTAEHCGYLLTTATVYETTTSIKSPVTTSEAHRYVHEKSSTREVNVDTRRARSRHIAFTKYHVFFSTLATSHFAYAQSPL